MRHFLLAGAPVRIGLPGGELGLPWMLAADVEAALPPGTVPDLAGYAADRAAQGDPQFCCAVSDGSLQVFVDPILVAGIVQQLAESEQLPENTLGEMARSYAHAAVSVGDDDPEYGRWLFLHAGLIGAQPGGSA